MNLKEEVQAFADKLTNAANELSKSEELIADRIWLEHELDKWFREAKRCESETREANKALYLANERIGADALRIAKLSAELKAKRSELGRARGSLTRLRKRMTATVSAQ